jgi:GT2 family glycosyltransferase
MNDTATALAEEVYEDTTITDEHPQLSPLVSVVIVTYNGMRYIAGCLDSLLQQRFEQGQSEVIVIVNASQDGTPAFVAAHYPSVRLFQLDRNYGPNEALQRAVTLAHGRYIAYLNQDVIVHRRWLPELMEVMQAHPKAGVVESNMILPEWPEYQAMDLEGPISRAYVCDVTRLGTHDFHTVAVTPLTPAIPVLSVYGAGCLLNPAILDSLGYWLEPDFFAYADDLDLGLRLNVSGYQVLLAPRSVVYHSTDWHFKWDRRSLRRAYWVTRNTVLAFYKVCYLWEFCQLLPRLLLGKLLKAGEHHRSPVWRLAYALAALPLLLVSLAAALSKLPAYRARRQLTLQHRVMPNGWLVERMRNVVWRPDRSIWLRKSE